MAFGRDKVKNDLKKAIYKAIAKAYKQNIPFVKEAVDGISKEHAVNHIIADLEDENNVAEVPENHIPVDKDNVLHKDIPSVKEMHDAKQAQAKAKLGMMPSEGQKGAVYMSEAPSKGVQKLKKFLGEREIKMGKVSDYEKGIHHPSPKNSDDGKSLAGHYARKGDSLANIHDHQSGKEIANSIHREKLAELKEMPKPSLPKSESLNKDEEGKTSLKDFHNMLSHHDWYHSYDDNIKTRMAGAAHEKKLKQIAEQSPQHAELFENYHKHMFSGPSFGTSKHPKPEPMDKARVDEGKTIREKQEARESRQWRTPHWVSSDLKAKIPAEIPHTTSKDQSRKMKQRHDGRPEWDPANAPSHKEADFGIADAEKGVHHRGDLVSSKLTHQKKLGELKAMPKPNLPKSEEMDKARVDEGKTAEQKRADRYARQESWERENMGTKRSGHSRDPEVAHFLHQGKLDQIRRSPKPNLPKSEEMSKGSQYEKGVHRPIGGKGKSITGSAVRGWWSYGDKERNKQKAAEQHQKVMSELKQMPKPNLGKADYQPHPGSSKSKHQQIYDAKIQADQEAYLKTPEGDKQRQIDNQKRIDAQKVKKAESKHDRCVRAVEESSPDVENPHAVCISRGVTPRKWKK